jgi:hypothetical protein
MSQSGGSEEEYSSESEEVDSPHAPISKHFLTVSVHQENEQLQNVRIEREPIYNVDLIHEKLEDISWTEEAGWFEVQAVTATKSTTVENVDDDLSRELAFYNQVSRLPSSRHSQPQR